MTSAASPKRELPTPLVSALLPLARRSLALIALPILSAGVAIAWTATHRVYVARSSFRVESGPGQLGQFATLAAQFGVNVAAPDNAAPPDFYRLLAQSREILLTVASDTFSIPERDGVRKATLVEYFTSASDPADLRLRTTYKMLQGDVSVDVDRITGVVEIRVASRNAALAEAINRRILHALNRFNVERRSSTAAVQRDFTRERLGDAERELRDSEAALRDFLERNRNYSGSPQLLEENRRLQRRVDLRQQVYTTLATAYEQARIEAERNIPVITVIERPEGSAESRSHLSRSAVLGFIVGILLAVAFAYGTEYIAFERQARPDAFGEIRDRIRRFWPTGAATAGTSARNDRAD